MKKKLAACIVILLLSLGVVPHMYAAEVWSDGDWQLGPPSTQDPGIPSSKTELWSENLWQENPPATPPSPQNPVTSPEGISGQKLPTVMIPATPPVIENGITLVPARDIFEPLGVELQFDSVKQLLTLRKENTVVHLILGHNLAMVNGNMVKLEAPAKMINGRAYIPLHSLSQILQYKVDFETTTTKVTIDGWLSFYLNADQAKTFGDQAKPSNSIHSFIGSWSIWIPGGYATTGTTINGDGSTTVTQEYVKGAEGYTLSILANGTYSWQTTGGTITGVWKAEPDGRIILVKGKYEFDWYVTQVNENEITFYSFGLEEYGTRIK